MTGSLHWITHCYHLQVALQTRTHPCYTNESDKYNYGTFSRNDVEATNRFKLAPALKMYGGMASE